MNVDSKSDETAMVCNFLARFQGFNANGYFDVNHSLLTGMTANFVTYLVIMIVGEDVKKDLHTYICGTESNSVQTSKIIIETNYP